MTEAGRASSVETRRTPMWGHLLGLGFAIGFGAIGAMLLQPDLVVVAGSDGPEPAAPDLAWPLFAVAAVIAAASGISRRVRVGRDLEVVLRREFAFLGLVFHSRDTPVPNAARVSLIRQEGISNRRRIVWYPFELQADAPILLGSHTDRHRALLAAEAVASALQLPLVDTSLGHRIEREPDAIGVPLVERLSESDRTVPSGATPRLTFRESGDGLSVRIGPRPLALFALLPGFGLSILGVAVLGWAATEGFPSEMLLGIGALAMVTPIATLTLAWARGYLGQELRASPEALTVRGVLEARFVTRDRDSPDVLRELEVVAALFRGHLRISSVARSLEVGVGLDERELSHLRARLAAALAPLDADARDQ